MCVVIATGGHVLVWARVCVCVCARARACCARACVLGSASLCESLSYRQSPSSVPPRPLQARCDPPKRESESEVVRRERARERRGGGGGGGCRRDATDLRDPAPRPGLRPPRLRGRLRLRLAGRPAARGPRPGIRGPGVRRRRRRRRRLGRGGGAGRCLCGQLGREVSFCRPCVFA